MKVPLYRPPHWLARYDLPDTYWQTWCSKAFSALKCYVELKHESLTAMTHLTPELHSLLKSRVNFKCVYFPSLRWYDLSFHLITLSLKIKDISESWMVRSNSFLLFWAKYSITHIQCMLVNTEFLNNSVTEHSHSPYICSPHKYTYSFSLSFNHMSGIFKHQFPFTLLQHTLVYLSTYIFSLGQYMFKGRGSMKVRLNGPWLL